MSCLFISIGRLLGTPHATIRQNICDYMQDHMDRPHQGGISLREWIGWQNQSSSAESYIEAMRSSHEWGGAMELSVATQCYHCDIVVVDLTGKQVAEFVWRDRFTSRCRLVLVWTGNHYEPVNKRVL